MDGIETVSCAFLAISTDGTVLHCDGETWTPMASGSSEHLRAVWGSSPKNVYAVGRNCTVLWYDGKSWEDVSPDDCAVDLTSVWLDEESDVIAIGSYGTILRGRR